MSTDVKQPSADAARQSATIDPVQKQAQQPSVPPPTAKPGTMRAALVEALAAGEALRAELNVIKHNDPWQQRQAFDMLSITRFEAALDILRAALL